VGGIAVGTIVPAYRAFFFHRQTRKRIYEKKVKENYDGGKKEMRVL
jgi:hypothetical protein